MAIPSPMFDGETRAPICFVDETDSTMDAAARQVRHGTPSGTVVVTDFQRAGRGRRAGRAWYARPRESLMFTLAERSPERPARRSLAMAAAIVLELEAAYGIGARVKWPNDILVADRKIAGILADYDGWLYLGVGLNMAQSAFPDELAASATSIRLAAPDATMDWPRERDRLLVAVLERYVDTIDAWQPTLDERLWMRNERVALTAANGEGVSGTLRGIADDGCLLLETDRIERIAAGELTLERTNG